MRVRALVLALVWLVSSVAEARDPKRGSVDSEPDPDVPAAEPAVDEDLWTWISRLDGEVPTPEAREAMEERSEEELSEMGLIDQLANADVPADFYKDPAGVLKPDPLHLDKIDPSEFDIPIVVNDDVVKWMRYFTGPGRKYYERYLARAPRYRPLMYREIEKRGLPRDLVYLSMIESGYNPHAYSAADAAGLWQFIESTARLYDLRVDWWIDERRDPQRSTEAGLTFLADLHKMFGDWYLAFASYNTGPGRVKRAVERAGSKNFYDLTKQNLLHPETANYVPKLVAAAIIGKHPERYGFTNIEGQPELVYESTKVDGTVDLEVLAKCAGLSLEDFQTLNPALRRYATPAEGFVVRLPVGTTDAFVAKLAEVPPAERIALVEHRVKRGETLSVIAKKYSVSTAEVVKANRLQSANKIYVGMKLVIPTKGRSAEAVARVAEASSKPSGDARVADATTGRRATDAEPAPTQAPVVVVKPKYHTVRSGDTLSGIAARYKVSVSQVKTWNKLRSDRIMTGQKLKVSAGSTAPATAAKTPAPAKEAPAAAPETTAAKDAPAKSTAPASDDKPAAPVKTEPSLQKMRYTVKRGDALSAIAAKHKVSVAEIQKWNKLGRSTAIQAGQVLTLYVDTPDWSQYTVRSGDTLTEIAAKQGCSVDDLKAWNNLSSSSIQVGQVLKIRK